MADSTHRVEVVPIVLKPHPNAEALSLVDVDNYSCVVRTQDWIGIDKGAYVQPDSVVDSSKPWFAWLKGHERVRVKRFRGALSQGLLVPAPEGSEIGQDVAEQLGVTRYESPHDLTQGICESPPPGYHPTYDVENWYRYGQIFQPGESVVVTEKIHGASGRWCYVDGKFYCGSRNTWKKEDPNSPWWIVLNDNPCLAEFLKAHPDITIYGEIYGWVQSLRYGLRQGIVRLAVFDLLRADPKSVLSDAWVPYAEAKELAKELPWVPEIYVGLYDKEAIVKMADGESLIPNAHHVREGIVIKTAVEKPHVQVEVDRESGHKVIVLERAQLKIVSPLYLEKDKS